MDKILPQQPAAQVTLTQFPDGGLYRYVQNPGRAGTFALIDVEGATVAVVINSVLADILCRGAYLFVSALKESKPVAAPLPQPDPQFLAGN